MRLLVFNAGSSSLKFDLMAASGVGSVRRLKNGAFVDVADGSGHFVLQTSEPALPRPAPIRTLSEAADFLLDCLSSAAAHGHNLPLEVIRVDEASILAAEAAALVGRAA